MKLGKELNRHKDNIHRAYCRFMLIKKKCDFNIYEEVDDLLDDVLGHDDQDVISKVQDIEYYLFGDFRKKQLSKLG